MNGNRHTAATASIFAPALLVLVLVLVTAVRAETLRGTVVDRQGKPVGGAVVWGARPYEYGPLLTRETQTDDSGRFALEVLPGKWSVWARHDGWAGEVEQYPIPRVLPGHDAGPYQIRLDQRGYLRVRLNEAETGRPIVGGRFVIDNAVELKANRLGRCEMPGIMPRLHEAYVVAPGRERRRILFDMTTRNAAELELRIPRGARIFGRVTDDQGRPIPGALVGYSASGNPFSGTANWERCDADGRYAWDGKPFDRPTRLDAVARGFQGQAHDGLVKSGQGPLELNFRLKRDSSDERGAKSATAPPEDPTRDVAGSVTLPDGRPAADASVRWVWPIDFDVRQTRTDARGRFRLAGMPVEAGFVLVIPAGENVAPATAPVPAGGNRDVDVALPVGETAMGTVRDDAGAPLDQVAVVPYLPFSDPRFADARWQMSMSLPERAAWTDAQGRFTLQGLPKAVKFRFHGEGLEPVHRDSLARNGAANEVRMQSAGMIRGRVVDAEGKPVRNFRILVNHPHDRQAGGKFGRLLAVYTGVGITFTSEDGSFVITGLGEPGAVCRISALAEGYGEGSVDRVISTTRAHLPPADALLIRLGPPHPLRIRVVHERGESRPVAGALVTLVDGDPELDRAFSWGFHDVSWTEATRVRTDENGHVELPALAYEGATVLVQAPGFGRRRVAWRDGRAELTIALAPEAVLAGGVVDAGGSPLREGHVVIVGSSGDRIVAPVVIEPGKDLPGRFRLDQLPAGRYTLMVQADEAGRHQEQVELRPGQTLDRSIRLTGEAPAGSAPGNGVIRPR